MNDDEEYEWECLVCGCSDLDPTGEFFEGKQIYCCPDCGNKQQKKYTSNIGCKEHNMYFSRRKDCNNVIFKCRKCGKEEIYKRIE
jgi:hypothetical protein